MELFPSKPEESKKKKSLASGETRLTYGDAELEFAP
jgi:hypothetical protein